jgi:DNA polymerase elongation subunit (family B)
MSESPKLRILTIDIETKPSLAYVWDVWKVNIQPRQLLEEKETICFAAKWLGEKNVIYFSTFHHGKDRMLSEAWRLLDEADAVISYNGKRFDVPHLNLEFLRSGRPPPSPFKNIDLLLTVRHQFNFTHNKLDHVADKLGIGRKMEHEGFDLWLKCMKNDKGAWGRMKKYNIQDVILTEKLYKKILPWIEQHPNYAAVLGDRRCPNCGSERLKKIGFRYTLTGAYQRLKCQKCGKFSRDVKRIHGAKVTQTASW